ncbi:MAG: hypothetical protein V4581_16760 [Bacteroidota bacterium]
MYTDSEIINIALACKEEAEVMKAAKLFRYLMCQGFQASSSFIAWVFITRFREVTC